MKTLLEIILADFRAAGRRGQLTLAFVKRWRADNPGYAKWPLSTRYRSGSILPVRGASRLDRATAAWLADGQPSPNSAAFDRAAFNAYVDAYRDEYDLEDDGPAAGGAG